jgi:hypothetical protein
MERGVGWEEGTQQRCTNKLLIQICPVLFTVNGMLRKYEYAVKHNTFTKVLEYSVRDQSDICLDIPWANGFC